MFPEITRKIQCFFRLSARKNCLNHPKLISIFVWRIFFRKVIFLEIFYEFIISFRTNTEKFWVVPLKMTYTLAEKWFGLFVPGKSPIVRCFSDFDKESARQCPQRWLFFFGKAFFSKIIFKKNSFGHWTRIKSVVFSNLLHMFRAIYRRAFLRPVFFCFKKYSLINFWTLSKTVFWPLILYWLLRVSNSFVSMKFFRKKTSKQKVLFGVWPKNFLTGVSKTDFSVSRGDFRAKIFCGKFLICFFFSLLAN